jgi:phage terminase large subunit GpA-like protein
MNLTERLQESRRKALRPPPKLTLPEWSDQFRHIAKQNSANPGEWRTSRVPIAYGPMLAVTERDTQVISMMACTQIIKTEFLINAAGYFIHQDPASILFVQPTQKLAENFSKERFQPTRDATPVLRELIPDNKSRDAGVTITHKEYPGGTLDFVGANSPVDLASRPKRITLADEIDLYPADAGGMGDPLALAEERSSTFKKRKRNIRTCSPSDELTSRINREYLASDQRRCFIDCPHCGKDQVLDWHVTTGWLKEERKPTIVWDVDSDGNNLPHTVRYHCVECGVGWSEAERIQALRKLIDKPDRGWRQTRRFKCCGLEQEPSQWSDAGRSLCEICGNESAYDGHAGFHVSKLYSTRHEMADVVKEYLGATTREKQRKFLNTALARVFREKITVLDPRALEQRCETYTIDAAPKGVRLVTCGVDTQDDRLELTFLGFGYFEEMWILGHQVLFGDTSKRLVWSELDEVLKRKCTTIDGRELSIQATGIDSQGHRGEMVHGFCRQRKYRRIYAMKGMGNDERGSKLIWPRSVSRTKNHGDKLYVIGVDTAKDYLFSILENEYDPANDLPTPRAVHFPARTELSADYFDQLTAEQAVTEYKNNVAYRRWEKKTESSRNETLDCIVYAIAARLSLPNRLDVPTAKQHDDSQQDRLPKAPVESKVAPEITPEQPVAAKVSASDLQRQARRKAWARR